MYLTSQAFILANDVAGSYYKLQYTSRYAIVCLSTTKLAYFVISSPIYLIFRPSFIGGTISSYINFTLIALATFMVIT